VVVALLVMGAPVALAACSSSSSSPTTTSGSGASVTTAATAVAAQSAAHGETTTPVHGVGDAAYSLTVSGGGFTTKTFAVLKGTNEVQVNGPGTPAQAQVYATQLVGKL
jgi:hypothetical protein